MVIPVCVIGSCWMAACACKNLDIAFVIRQGVYASAIVWRVSRAALSVLHLLKSAARVCVYSVNFTGYLGVQLEWLNLCVFKCVYFTIWEYIQVVEVPLQRLPSVLQCCHPFWDCCERSCTSLTSTMPVPLPRVLYRSSTGTCVRVAFSAVVIWLLLACTIMQVAPCVYQ